MNNLNPYEVQKFTDMAANWWDLNGPCKLLHLVNPVRVMFIQNCIDLAEQNILDVGCGAGILTESLAQLTDKNIYGIDASKAAIQAAQDHAKSQLDNTSNNFKAPIYLNSTIEQFAKSSDPTNNKFEVITCLELIEHVPDPEALIKSISELLAPNGHLFISTLNRTIKSYLEAIIGAEYILKFLPKGTHEYKSFLKPSEIWQMAKKYKLSPKAIKGLRYNPILKNFSLTDDVSVNYIMHLQKQN